MFSEDQGFLGFGSCFQRTKGSGSWLMFSRASDFWILAHVFRGLKVFWVGSWLMFSEDQRFFGPWLMFSEDQRFLILAHVFRGLGFLNLGSCF